MPSWIMPRFASMNGNSTMSDLAVGQDVIVIDLADRTIATA